MKKHLIVEMNLRRLQDLCDALSCSTLCFALSFFLSATYVQAGGAIEIRDESVVPNFTIFHLTDAIIDQPLANDHTPLFYEKSINMKNITNKFEKDESGRRLLPTMENGGIVFFLHVPKAGGTTVRLNLQKAEHVDYHFGRNKTSYLETVPLVEKALVHGTESGRVLVLEVHALDSPSLLQLKDRLSTWRVMAKQNGINVFFFTILREPLSYSLSHFNFFHVQRRNDSFEQCNATEADFLRLSLDNPQCQFLASGERSMRLQKRLQRSVSVHTCLDLVYETLIDTMDWVGTTEKLSNQTLPLLARVLRLKPSFRFRNHRVTSKIQNQTLLDAGNLSSSSINAIHRMSYLDRELYHRIQEDFAMKMWI